MTTLQVFLGSSWSGKSLLQLSSCIILTIIFVKTIFRVYFHPLRSFPGPFWARLTDFYHTYLLATREAHLKQLELHEKYGMLRHA